jgi:hypothetical protein
MGVIGDLRTHFGVISLLGGCFRSNDSKTSISYKIRIRDPSTPLWSQNGGKINMSFLAAILSNNKSVGKTGQ